MAPPPTDGVGAAADGDGEPFRVPLGTFWSEWSRCLTATYQRDQLYRMGRLDDCAAQWADLKAALRATWTSDAEARRLVAGTRYVRCQGVSPTAGIIWEMKAVPGWDTAAEAEAATNGKR